MADTCEDTVWITITVFTYCKDYVYISLRYTSIYKVKFKPHLAGRTVCM